MIPPHRAAGKRVSFMEHPGVMEQRPVLLVLLGLLGFATLTYGEFDETG